MSALDWQRERELEVARRKLELERGYQNMIGRMDGLPMGDDSGTSIGQWMRGIAPTADAMEGAMTGLSNDFGGLDNMQRMLEQDPERCMEIVARRLGLPDLGDEDEGGDGGDAGLSAPPAEPTWRNVSAPGAGGATGRTGQSGGDGGDDEGDGGGLSAIDTRVGQSRLTPGAARTTDGPLRPVANTGTFGTGDGEDGAGTAGDTSRPSPEQFQAMTDEQKLQAAREAAARDKAAHPGPDLSAPQAQPGQPALSAAPADRPFYSLQTKPRDPMLPPPTDTNAKLNFSLGAKIGGLGVSIGCTTPAASLDPKCELELGAGALSQSFSYDSASGRVGGQFCVGAKPYDTQLGAWRLPIKGPSAKMCYDDATGQVTGTASVGGVSGGAKRGSRDANVGIKGGASPPSYNIFSFSSWDAWNRAANAQLQRKPGAVYTSPDGLPFQVVDGRIVYALPQSPARGPRGLGSPDN